MSNDTDKTESTSKSNQDSGPAFDYEADWMKMVFRTSQVMLEGGGANMSFEQLWKATHDGAPLPDLEWLNPHRDKKNTDKEAEGINKLPDDVLARILDHASIGTEGTTRTGGPAIEYAWNLLQVCSRFRAIMLATPTIWAKIEMASRLAPTLINAILEYSKGLPLTACLTAGFTVKKQEMENVKLMFQHRERFDEIHLHIVQRPENVEVYKHFRDFDFPNVESLTLNSAPIIPPGMNPMYLAMMPRIRVDDLGPQIYESWSLPKLKTLHTDVVPLPVLGKNLTKCVFHNAHHIFDPRPLLEFLASSSQLLETLEVILSKNKHTGEDALPTQVVELPHLKSLILRIEGNISSCIVGAILENIRAENLTELNIADLVVSFSPDATLARRETACYMTISETIIRFITKHRRLRDLTVLNDFSDDDYGDTGPEAFRFERFDRVLSDLPNTLDRAIFSSPLRLMLFHWETPQKDNGIRRLKRLELFLGGDLTIEYLRGVRKAVIKDGPDPETIVFGNWPGVRLDELQALFPQSKILTK